MNNGFLIASVVLGDTHKPTGRVQHWTSGTGSVRKLLPTPKELRIISYGPGAFHLVHYDAETHPFTDTFHFTLEEALEQGDWEFQVKKDDWDFSANS